MLSGSVQPDCGLTAAAPDGGLRGAIASRWLRPRGLPNAVAFIGTDRESRDLPSHPSAVKLRKSAESFQLLMQFVRFSHSRPRLARTTRAPFLFLPEQPHYVLNDAND